MALITCPECGKRVSSFAPSCPQCGYPLAAESNHANMLIEDQKNVDCMPAQNAQEGDNNQVNEDDQTKQSKQPEQNKQNSNGCSPGCIVAVIIVFVIIIIASQIGNNSSSTYSSSSGGSTSSSSSDRSIDAWVCAEKAVQDTLKSPSTAEFCSYPDADITYLGASKYKIVGYVDAENSFGATLRKNFTVTLTLTDEGFKDYSVDFE